MTTEILVQGVFPQLAQPVVEQDPEKSGRTDQDMAEPRGWALQWDGGVLSEMLADQNGCALPSPRLTQTKE